jgi:hypothetical protein
MNSTASFTLLLSSAVTQLPILVVAVVGIVFSLMKRRQAPQAALWAILGFGLTLALCIFVPTVQTIIQLWVMEGDSPAQRASVFAGLGILWSLLRAISYLLLLVAVFVGRSAHHQPPHLPARQGI